MGDFPEPTRRAKTAYRTNDAPAESTDAPQKNAVLVSRPEPPSEEREARSNAPGPRANMTKEEIAALLAVTETNQLTRWGRVGDRAKRAALPVMLLSTLLGVAVGDWAALIPIVLGIAYSAWPLVTQKHRGWT